LNKSWWSGELNYSTVISLGNKVIALSVTVHDRNEAGNITRKIGLKIIIIIIIIIMGQSIRCSRNKTTQTMYSINVSATKLTTSDYTLSGVLMISYKEQRRGRDLH